MKYFILIALFHASFIVDAQQGVAINTDGSTPHESAILDLKSTTKGFLLPRLTILQRLAMTSPTPGLMVYQTNGINLQPRGLYIYEDSWKRIADSEDVPEPMWQKGVGNFQYSTTPNVGIGIQNPDVALHIRTNDALQQIKLEGNTPGISFTRYINGNFNTAGRIYGSESNIVLGTGLGNPTGRVVFETGGRNQAYIDPAGIFHTSSEIRLTTDNFTSRAFLQLAGGPSLNDFRLGTVSGNNIGNIIFRTNGADAVKVTPSGDLVPLNNIQFAEGEIEKAYIQLSGDNLRLGTNVGNTTGKVIIRTNGYNNFQFTENGKLLNINEESMLPLGYATFNGSGNKVSGTSNISGGWIGTIFKLDCTSDITNATVMITPRGAKMMSSWEPNGSSTSINIYFYDSDDDERSGVGFSVVIYK